MTRPAPRREDRGAVVPTVALFMLVLFGFFSLAFNMGLIMSSRAQLQNASDSAALAAARSLNGEASGLIAARKAAEAFGREHIAAGEEVEMDGAREDVVFGRWHLRPEECLFGGGADCFEPLSSDQPRKITAVKVYNGRDGQPTHNQPIELPFGAFVGASTSSVDSAAVAVGAGAATVECALPLAVAECKLLDEAGKMKCNAGPQRMVFSNANVDAVGFINLYYPEDQQAPSGNFAADVIRDRRCNAKNYKVGPAKLQNGTDFAKVIDALRGTDNKGDAVGACLLGQSQSMAVTDAGCPGNPIFQGVQEVVGFVKATVVAVTDNHGDLLGCPGVEPPALTGPFEKNAVIVDISCQSAAGEGEWGGGRSYNSSDVRVRLVD